MKINEKTHSAKKPCEANNDTLFSVSPLLAAVRNRSDLERLVGGQLQRSFGFIGSLITHADAENGSEEVLLKTWEDNNDIRIQFPQLQKLDLYTKSPENTALNIIDLLKIPSSDTVPEIISWLKENGIHQLTKTPLRAGDRTTGSLYLFFRRPEVTAENRLSYRMLADLLSIVIVNIKANEKIEAQLLEIKAYQEQLEDEKLYLREQIETSYPFGEVIGQSDVMKRVFHLVDKVAGSDSTVLILGETGTGKELIARAIHSASSRKDKIMIKLNCATLPSSLIESELFGHEKGSFTGATERRIGKFELANNSSLFLDEIGELSLELQVKLLRALQEKEIERIGGKSVLKVNVRIVAATNRNLLKEVQEGRFRSDLYYRLNVFPITLPPLRERKEDIGLLTAHFLARYSKKTGKIIRGISQAAHKKLMAYHWPGNIRELEHLIERSVLLAGGNTIKDLTLPRADMKDAPALKTEVKVKSIFENERDHILDILRMCRGKISGTGGAAEILGIPATTLNSKIKKFHIKREHIFRSV